MTKLGAVFWLGMVFASGFSTYMVKYAVQNIDGQLTRVRRQTVAAQQEIRVLNAEWTYLNTPERLAELNQRFLKLAPIVPRQLQQKIENIPLRPPVAAPDVVVAAATPAPVVATRLQSAAPTPNRATAPTAMQPAAPSAAPAPTPVAGAEPGSRPPLTIAALSREVARERLPVRIATADSTPAPASLDALIAQIAEKP